MTLTPQVVSAEEWQAAHEKLLAKEKQATHARDALAAERRRQPMMEIEKDYVLHGPDGDVGLFDLFEGRRQLILYHFMWQRMGDPSERCEGCSMVIDNVGHLAHFHARDTTFAIVSYDAPVDEIEAFKRRMDWEQFPWYSVDGLELNEDLDAGRFFGLNVFLRDGDRILRSYFTTARGVEALGSVWSFLDLTPLGRQENWEDSPEGVPQTPALEWWKLHDEYETASAPT
jgi:predicted dithiol-disulfide oxidoreductase (DUF899 family)